MIPPLTLRVASGVVVVQAICEAAGLGWREHLRWPLRLTLICVIGAQIVFARRVLRLLAGSFFAVMIYEVATLVAATATRAPLLARGALATSALGVIALLVASLPAFPSPDLPVRPGGGR